MNGNGQGDDLKEKMRAATEAGGGGMMREICAVLRSGDAKGAAPAQAPIGAVYMDDNKVGGHVISGPGYRMEIESIMRGRNARRYAYERAVRLMMTGGMAEEGQGNDEEEGEEESARDKWIEERVTMERFEASLSKAKAEKGTCVDGWNDYLLKKTSRGVKVKYYEVLKEVMFTKEFPDLLLLSSRHQPRPLTLSPRTLLPVILRIGVGTR